MSARGVPRRRTIRGRRRLAGWSLLLTPTAVIAGLDLLRRSGHIAGFDRPHLLAYVASIVESAVFWGVILYVASRRKGAVRHVAAGLFAVLFTLAAGVQSGFLSLYNVYIGLDGQIHSKSIFWSIFGHL